MVPNPFLGVLFHWIGGLASGSFYVPFRQVRGWSWETYWLVGGVCSWIICPWLFAGLMTNDLIGVLCRQAPITLWWTYFFGAMWGLGGLSFGLTMRYLGMSLGMGVALGYCAAFGTLTPPILKTFWGRIPVPENILEIAATRPGQITLAGVGVCLLGIAIAALAGLTKEREMSPAEKQRAVAEFDFKRGILVATFSGIMSACFSFALTAGMPIGTASLQAGTPEIWSGLPKLVIVLLGGFTTNFIWCVILNIKNRTGYQYLDANRRPEQGNPESDELSQGSAVTAARKVALDVRELRVPMLQNYVFCAIAGATWYFQFFFYTMGETQMGKFGFASWTLHMASIIVFSTMWGWIFHEWKGCSKKAHAFIVAGIGILILSTAVIGVGSYLKGVLSSM